MTDKTKILDEAMSIDEATYDRHCAHAEKNKTPSSVGGVDEILDRMESSGRVTDLDIYMLRNALTRS